MSTICYQKKRRGVNKMAKDTWTIGRIRSSGYVFDSKYQPKAYTPAHMKWYKYVVATLAFSLGIWMLFYILGVRV